MRHKNKKKEIDLIKNSNNVSSEEALRFNTFSLKNFYRTSNRSKMNLHKINENENENEYSAPRSNNRLNSEYDSDYHMEKIDQDDNDKNIKKFIEPFSKEITKSPKKEIQIQSKSKMISDENKNNLLKNSNIIIQKNEQKEINENNFSTISENKEQGKLKNLNTNDTTSLRSSENSFSKNSLYLNYSVNLIYLKFILFHFFRKKMMMSQLFYQTMKRNF